MFEDTENIRPRTEEPKGWRRPVSSGEYAAVSYAADMCAEERQQLLLLSAASGLILAFIAFEFGMIAMGDGIREAVIETVIPLAVFIGVEIWLLSHAHDMQCNIKSASSGMVMIADATAVGTGLDMTAILKIEGMKDRYCLPVNGAVWENCKTGAPVPFTVVYFPLPKRNGYFSAARYYGRGVSGPACVPERTTTARRKGRKANE